LKRSFLKVAGHKRKKLKLGLRAIFPHDLRRMDWLGTDPKKRVTNEGLMNYDFLGDDRERLSVPAVFCQGCYDFPIDVPGEQLDRRAKVRARLGENILVEAAKSLFLILSALFPIVDPLGGSPIFLTMTREYAPSTRRALPLLIARNSFFLLAGSYFTGTHILYSFGISLSVVLRR
jgi:MarC family integral membrane protein